MYECPIHSASPLIRMRRLRLDVNSALHKASFELALTLTQACIRAHINTLTLPPKHLLRLIF